MTVRKQIFTGKFDQARDECGRLARSGNLEAQACYAAMLWDGVGGQRDEALAESWAMKASTGNSAYGTYLLAHFAYSDKKMKLALRWMRQSANQQFPPAVMGLGRFLILGIGTRIDTDAGLRCYWQARELGHCLATFAIWDYWSRRAPSKSARLYASVRRLLGRCVHYIAGIRRPFDPMTMLRNFD
jgi:TPR repeat protein